MDDGDFFMITSFIAILIAIGFSILYYETQIRELGKTICQSQSKDKIYSDYSDGVVHCKAQSNLTKYQGIKIQIE